MKKILSILLVLTLLLSFSCKNNDAEKQNIENNEDTILYPQYDEFANEVDDTTQSENQEVDSSQTTNNENNNVMVEDENGNPVPATDADITDSPTKNFYIIVGSYQNDKYAEQRKEDFIKKGYTAKVLPKFGKYNRVSAAMFNNETSARAELKSLRTKFNDKSYWLLFR